MFRSLICIALLSAGWSLSGAGIAADRSTRPASNKSTVSTQPKHNVAETSPPASRVPDNAEQTSPDVVAQAPTPAAASSSAAQSAVPPPPRFDIERFEVQGNTLLGEPELADALNRYIGKSKDFADVQRALESLQRLYQGRGYGTVQVLLPEQELERGVIVLRVIEPKLGKVTVDGNKFFDEDNIRRSVPALKEGTTPNANDITLGVRVANENPVKRTNVLLRTGENEGEINATIRVQDEKPWRAAVSLDNTGTPSSGEYRLGVAYQHANLFNLDHTLTVQYLVDPSPLNEIDQLKIFGVGYRIPLYELGATLDLAAGYSSLGATSSQVVQSQSFNMSGSGTIFSLRYNQNLPRLRGIDDFEHRLSFGLDYKAFSNQVIREGLGFNETPDVTVYPLSVAYSGTKRWDSGEFGFFGSLAYNAYPHGNDANKERFTDPAPPFGEGAARGVGDPHYSIWRYGVNFMQAFANDMQVRLNYSGQWTRDALVPGEQFSIGGWDSLRGMIERETANDRGWRGSFEVYSPDAAPKMGWDGARLRFLGFVDTGSVRQNHQQPPCDDTECGLHATSIGLGLRLSMNNGVNLRLDWGNMLDPGAVGGRNHDRWHFGMTFLF